MTFGSTEIEGVVTRSEDGYVTADGFFFTLYAVSDAYIGYHDLSITVSFNVVTDAAAGSSAADNYSLFHAWLVQIVVMPCKLNDFYTL